MTRANDNTGSLGNTTEFASTRETTPQQRTAQRFFLQSMARELLPEHRIKICYRHRLPDATNVQVFHSPSKKRGRIAGTMKCKSAWVCAVCASYISERRREELQTALNNARDKYAPFLITYTIQHNREHSLQSSLDALQEAFRRFRSGRWWQTMKDEFSIVGSVRATEITWTPNAGWHPHYHEIVLVELDAVKGPNGEYNWFSEAMENHFSQQWVNMLQKEGRTAAVGVGLTVRGSTKDVANYVAKYDRLPIERERWGQAAELTKANTKTGRGESFSPFDLLTEWAMGKKWMGRLFAEYADTTHGRSMLQWSRGTKNLLDIETVSDAIAAEGESDDDQLLADIPFEDWKRIVRHNAQAAVLRAAHLNNAGMIADILQSLRKTDVGSSESRICASCMVPMDRKTTGSGELVHVCPECDREISA